MRWILVLVALFSCASVGEAACRIDAVGLRGEWGSAQFTIEIADDEEERARGLMFRESMPRTSGMLFVYEHPRRAVFWMKNTNIPLDMVFADRRGVVTHVHHDAIPHDLTNIDGGPGVFAVLEINAGLARQLGVKRGSEMRHPVFTPGPAAWPC